MSAATTSGRSSPSRSTTTRCEHGHEHERYLIELGTKALYLLGLCFCEHCLARAADDGVDGAAVQAAVRDEVERAFARRDAAVTGELERAMLADVAGGELLAYLDVRAATVTALAAEAAEVADAAGKRFVFMDPSGAVKGYWTGKPEGDPAAAIGWRLGIDLPALAAVCPEVQVLAYAADVERVRLDLEAYRARARRRDGLGGAAADPARLRDRRESRCEARARPRARADSGPGSTTTASCASRRSTWSAPRSRRA